MNRDVMFIQGAGTGAHEEDGRLVQSLQRLLGDGYTVHFPFMEGEAEASYDVLKRQIQREITLLSDGVVLVGHSVGAAVLLKCVAEEDLVPAVAGVFLIAAPFWGGKGWTYEGYEELVLPDRLPDRIPPGVPVFLYHARDDEVVPFEHLALHAEVLPQAELRALDPPRGHQLHDDLAEVAEDIRRLAG